MRQPIAYDLDINCVVKRYKQRTLKRQLWQPKDGPNKALKWDTPTKNKALGQLDAGKSYKDVRRRYGVPERTQRRWKKEGFDRRARRSHAPNMGALHKIGEAKLKRMIEHVKEGNYLNKIWSWEDLRLKYCPEVKDKETVKNAFNKRGYFKCKACQRTYIWENNTYKRLEFSNKWKDYPSSIWYPVRFTDKVHF